MKELWVVKDSRGSIYRGALHFTDKMQAKKLRNALNEAHGGGHGFHV